MTQSPLTPAPQAQPAAPASELSSTAPALASTADGDAVLDAEKLDCYRVAVEFQVFASSLVAADQRVLRDQLDRASVSIVLNIAESAGRRSRPDKRRFVAMARGSATECAAIVNLVLLRGLAPAQACRRARSLVVRIVMMLTKLDAALA